MSDEVEFQRFWQAYPKKRSKGDAFKAWRGTKERRPALEKLLKVLAVLKASPDWLKDGGQYIPYPSTWLRAWGWEDVPEVELEAVRPDGKVWWQTPRGIEEWAEKNGVKPWNGEYMGRPETWQQWAERVKKIALVNVIPLVKRA